MKYVPRKLALLKNFHTQWIHAHVFLWVLRIQLFIWNSSARSVYLLSLPVPQYWWKIKIFCFILFSFYFILIPPRMVCEIEGLSHKIVLRQQEAQSEWFNFNHHKTFWGYLRMDENGCGMLLKSRSIYETAPL